MNWIEPAFQKQLQQQGLNDFEALWSLPLSWFEAPNQRRGGWSGVARIQWGAQFYFIKKQYRHIRRTWRCPWGEPSFRNEARQLLFLHQHGIACPELVYYAESRGRAILINRQLDGFMDLEQAWAQMNAQQQRQIIKATAQLLRRLHQLRRVHNALYSKHIFVQPQSGQVALIDCEKMKSRSPRRAGLRDLDSLNRHSPPLSPAQKMRFILEYDRPHARQWLQALQQKAFKKGFIDETSKRSE